MYVYVYVCVYVCVCGGIYIYIYIYIYMYRMCLLWAIDLIPCQVDSTILEKGGPIGGQQCLKGEQMHLPCLCKCPIVLAGLGVNNRSDKGIHGQLRPWIHTTGSEPRRDMRLSMSEHTVGAH